MSEYCGHGNHSYICRKCGHDSEMGALRRMRQLVRDKEKKKVRDAVEKLLDIEKSGPIDVRTIKGVFAEWLDDEK